MTSHITKGLGHVAVRVGDVVYNHAGDTGMVKLTMEQVLNRYGDSQVVGIVYKKPPSETLDQMLSFFESRIAEGLQGYNTFISNCSQNSMLAINAAYGSKTGVIKSFLTKISSFDPIIPWFYHYVFMGNSNILFRTNYNSQKGTIQQFLTMLRGRTVLPSIVTLETLMGIWLIGGDDEDAPTK